MTCDDFQIAFEQRHAGVSAAISAAELDAHVAACAACTAYVSLSRKLGQSMTTAVSSAPALPTVEALLSRASAATRQVRRGRIVVPLVVSAVLAGWWLATHAVTPRTLLATLVGAIGGYLAGYVAMAWLLRKPIADLQALAGASSEELLAGWRREIERRIRLERQSWWLLPVLFVAFHLTVAGVGAPPPDYLGLEIVYLAALAAVLPLSVWRYRRLVRERDQLGA